VNCQIFQILLKSLSKEEALTNFSKKKNKKTKKTTFFIYMGFVGSLRCEGFTKKHMTIIFLDK